MMFRNDRTETYDDFAPVGEDSRWEKFSKFHEYLSFAFPQSYAQKFTFRACAS